MRVVPVCLRGRCAGLTEWAGEPLLLLSTGHLPAAAIRGLGELFQHVAIEIGGGGEGDDLLPVLTACAARGLDGDELDWLGQLLAETRVTYRQPVLGSTRPPTRGPRLFERCVRSSAAVLAAFVLAMTSGQGAAVVRVHHGPRPGARAASA